MSTLAVCGRRPDLSLSLSLSSKDPLLVLSVEISSVLAGANLPPLVRHHWLD